MRCLRKATQHPQLRRSRRRNAELSSAYAPTMPSRRDVEADLRRQLTKSAQAFVVLLSRGQTNAEAAVDVLAERAFGSPERLRDAAALLGDEDVSARALLTWAARYAQDPRRPGPPRRDPHPDVSRMWSED